MHVESACALCREQLVANHAKHDDCLCMPCLLQAAQLPGARIAAAAGAAVAQAADATEGRDRTQDHEEEGIATVKQEPMCTTKGPGTVEPTATQPQPSLHAQDGAAREADTWQAGPADGARVRALRPRANLRPMKDISSTTTEEDDDHTGFVSDGAGPQGRHTRRCVLPVCPALAQGE